MQGSRGVNRLRVKPRGTRPAPPVEQISGRNTFKFVVNRTQVLALPRIRKVLVCEQDAKRLLKAVNGRVASLSHVRLIAQTPVNKWKATTESVRTLLLKTCRLRNRDEEVMHRLANNCRLVRVTSERASWILYRFQQR